MLIDRDHFLWQHILQIYLRMCMGFTNLPHKLQGSYRNHLYPTRSWYKLTKYMWAYNYFLIVTVLKIVAKPIFQKLSADKFSSDLYLQVICMLTKCSAPTSLVLLGRKVVSPSENSATGFCVWYWFSFFCQNLL